MESSKLSSQGNFKSHPATKMHQPTTHTHTHIYIYYLFITNEEYGVRENSILKYKLI